MDVIAGSLGFYAPIARNQAKGEISFDAIEALRQQMCPEASPHRPGRCLVNARPAGHGNASS
jgi:hypothetical protein